MAERLSGRTPTGDVVPVEAVVAEHLAQAQERSDVQGRDDDGPTHLHRALDLFEASIRARGTSHGRHESSLWTAFSWSRPRARRLTAGPGSCFSSSSARSIASARRPGSSRNSSVPRSSARRTASGAGSSRWKLGLVRRDETGRGGTSR